MSTILGVSTSAGVVLAGDRRHVDGGIVTSDAVDRTLDLGYAGAVAVGSPGDVEEFKRELESELDALRTERGRDPTVTTVGKTAGRIAQETGVEAIVAGRNEESAAELRAVDDDGAVLQDDTAAFGSGAQLALSRLDATDFAEGLDRVVAQVRDVLTGVGERDADTGTDVDVVTVESQGRASDSSAGGGSDE